jgi:hypothetical protein
MQKSKPIDSDSDTDPEKMLNEQSQNLILNSENQHRFSCLVFIFPPAVLRFPSDGNMPRLARQPDFHRRQQKTGIGPVMVADAGRGCDDAVFSSSRFLGVKRSGSFI